MTIFFATNTAMAFLNPEGALTNRTSDSFDSAFTESCFYSSEGMLEVPLPTAPTDVWIHYYTEMGLHQNTGKTISGYNTVAGRDEFYWRRVLNNGAMSFHIWNGTGYTEVANLPNSSTPEVNMYVDLHYTIHPTNGVIELYFDEVLMMRAENLNTSGFNVDLIRFTALVSSPVKYSQIIIADEPTLCWRLMHRAMTNNVERISFIGHKMQAIAGDASGNTDLTLSGLTEGIRSTVQPDDYVVAAYAVGSTVDRTLSITDPDGVEYTQIGTEQHPNDDFDANLRVAFKKMGSTPDAFVRFGPTGATDDPGVIAVFVMSGADLSTFVDATVQGSVGNTSQFDPAAVTVITAMARIFIIGATAHDGTVTNFNNTQNLPIWLQLGSPGTNAIRMVFGMSGELSAGSINYGQITTNVEVNTSSVVNKVVAVRPQRVSQTFSDTPNDASLIYSSSGKSHFQLVASNTADQIIRARGFGYSTPSTGYEVKALSLSGRVMKGETGPQNINPLVRANFTDYHASDVTLSEGIDPVNQVWELNPATGQPWTVEESYCALVGFRSRT